MKKLFGIKSQTSSPTVATYTPHPAMPPMGSSRAIQEEMEKIIEAKKVEVKETKLKIFMEQPASVRELILEKLRKEAAEEALYKMKRVYPKISAREDDIAKVYHDMTGISPFDFTYICDTESPTYKELEKLHVDGVAREILLDDTDT